MLLQHPWLADLSKPDVISEEDDDEVAEEESAADSAADGVTDGTTAASTNGTTTTKSSSSTSEDPAYDDEVAQWVKSALERKASGLMGSSAKPALHAAPLDSVSSPAV